MPKTAKPDSKSKKQESFEASLWQSADKLRKNMDAAEYKHKGVIPNPADMISIYGQESNQTTWRLAKMNLAIRGIDSSNIKWNNEGSFLNDAHKDLKADFIIANPPFNDSDWSGHLLKDDARWKKSGLKITYSRPAAISVCRMKRMILTSPNASANLQPNWTSR